MKYKILLIGPYKSGELRIGQYLSPPLGVHRIASYLKSRGLADVDVLDCDLEGEEKFLDLVSSNRYDIIGFSLLQQTLKNDVELMISARRMCSSLLVAGGQGAAFNANFLFENSSVDIVVKGFGEFAMEHIVGALAKENSESFLDIPGIFVRTADCFVDTGDAKPYTKEEFEHISLCTDFSSIPYERYWRFMESVYTEKHLKIMRNDGMLRTIRLVTSSHCPMKCRFCSSTNFLDHAAGCQRPLLLRPEGIIRMMRNAKESHPSATSFYICDDDFVQDKKRVLEFCSLVEQEAGFAGMAFFCLSRVDRVDGPVLAAMKRAGFRFIIYGVESFSKKVLRDMGKRISHPQPAILAKEAIESTISAGMTPLMNLIIFYPTANVQDIIETIEHSISLVGKGARLTVYPYIEFYAGSDIASDASFEHTTTEPEICGKAVLMPEFVLPKDPIVRALAAESTSRLSAMRESILKRHSWEGVVPHPLNGIALFMTVYSLLGMDCSRLELLADRIMEDAAFDNNAFERSPRVRGVGILGS